MYCTVMYICISVHESDRLQLLFLLLNHTYVHRPDGVQLTAEQLREHEAIDIKVSHNEFNYTCCCLSYHVLNPSIIMFIRFLVGD